MVMAGAPNPKKQRQRAILELIAASPIGSQEELVDRLGERGFDVTQATVSRDITELGLVKVPRGDRHAYVAPEQAATGNAYDARLRRLLEDIPVRVGRSGLSIVLVATPGSAGAIAQAIDQSSLSEQVGTLAGDNTLLVLFADEASLERWFTKFQSFQPVEGQPWSQLAAPKAPVRQAPGAAAVAVTPDLDGNAPGPGTTLDLPERPVPSGELTRPAPEPQRPPALPAIPSPAAAAAEPATNPVRDASSARALAHSEAPR